MTKENVIALRDKLRTEKKAAIKLICDNMILVDEATEVVIWDDNNAVVRVIRPNPNAVDRKGANVQILAIEYDVIQYMYVSANKDVLASYIQQLTSDGLCSEEQANGIIRWANDFSVEPESMPVKNTTQPEEEPTTEEPTT